MLEEANVAAAGELGAHAGTTAEDVMAWTADVFGDKWIVASNMQDAVLIHLAVRVKPDVEVLFLDTGYHFAETMGMREAVTLAYPRIRVVDARAERSAGEQEAEMGQLYRDDPDRCCHLRKVVPLRRVLSRYDAWVTGVRRADSPARAGTPLIGWDERNGLVKANPLALWSDARLRAYIDHHRILENLLVSQGYPSIGCAPCTARPDPGADPRSGRWAGRAKTECGLHG
ncbi:phosphoadenylyl-sulfate reductase [Actinocrispum sp. NPDC049592]|uniref:phosphoadenylyl-sulfate reductase n=1 Tax=Actinocrispum sp. NPDC049592 TaxID=3154835 RepID=UPI0034299BC0